MTAFTHPLPLRTRPAGFTRRDAGASAPVGAFGGGVYADARRRPQIEWNGQDAVRVDAMQGSIAETCSERSHLAGGTHDGRTQDRPSESGTGIRGGRTP